MYDEHVSQDVRRKVRRGFVSKRSRTLRRPKSRLRRVLLGLFLRFEDWMASKTIQGDKPVYSADDFPWVREIESEWQAIRAELDRVMTYRSRLANFHDITDQVKTITDDQNWKTYFLLGYGLWSERSAERCPETVRIIKKIPGLKSAMFSILSPGKLIPSHRGPYNGVLRLHLGLLVPEPREKCRIRVDEEIHCWEEGKSLIFDDTFQHQVWNETDGHRVVLFVDFERPLKFPARLLNRAILSLARFTPVVRHALKNQKNWEKNFYDT